MSTQWGRVFFVRSKMLDTVCFRTIVKGVTGVSKKGAQNWKENDPNCGQNMLICSPIDTSIVVLIFVSKKWDQIGKMTQIAAKICSCVAQLTPQ